MTEISPSPLAENMKRLVMSGYVYPVQASKHPCCPVKENFNGIRLIEGDNMSKCQVLNNEISLLENSPPEIDHIFR